MSDMSISSDNVRVGPDGSVITVTEAQPFNHGAYRCVASNPFGITHTIVSLIIKGTPHSPSWTHTHCCRTLPPSGETPSFVLLPAFAESPVVTVIPVGPLRVRVGDPINLECQASGEPRPTVSWHRLDSNRKTMLSSPVPMESNAVMQVPAP